jgi:hypothetical protein
MLLSAAALSAAGAAPIPPGDAVSFRMVRKGSEIGRHTLRFDRSGGELTVHIAVDATVTLLSVPIVRYTHRVEETWRDGILIAAKGQTDRNGRPGWADARRTGEGLVVTGSRTERYVAPEPAIGTTYWNRRMIDGPMISMEDGVLLRPTVARVRDETIPLASGATIDAERYSLRGGFSVDVWYDRGDAWASLELAAVDGSVVRYERL